LLLIVTAVAAIPASAANMIVGATSLSFNAVQGANPPAQSFYAYSDTAGTAFNPTVTASTNNGGNWLTLSFANGASLTTTLQVVVQVNSQGLSAGFYTGQIRLTQSGLGGSPATVAVSLQVFPQGSVNYAVSPAVIEASAQLGANASSQTLSITVIGGTSVAPQYTATTATGGNWLALSAPVTYTFNTTSTVQVNFNTASLAAGFYTGTITAAGTGIQNSPVSIPVNLRVGTTTAGPTLAAAPASVGFNAALGQNPAPVTLAINNTGQGTISPIITTATASGGGWLNVTTAPASAGTGGGLTATVTANITGLAAGMYTGAITVTDGGATNSPLMIPVSLSLLAPAPVLALSASTLSLAANTGAKSSGTINLTNTGVGALNFTAAASAVGGGTWLSVTPASGSAPATLNITADATALAIGIYTGNVQVTVTNATSGSQSPQNIAVTFAVGVPAINSGGIVNGANFTSQLVAAGEIISAFGSNMGPSPGQQTQATAGSLPVTAAGTKVTFDGIPGPLFYVSSNQLNIQAPFELAGKTSTTVVLTSNGQTGPPFVLNLRATDPAVFIANQRMAILNASGALITPTNPAHVGDTLSLYATGLGPVSAQCTVPACTAITIATGQLAPLTPLFNTQSQATVTIAGVAAQVSFSGLAPSFCGLYQVNFTVPSGVGTGDQPLVLGVGLAASAPLPLAIR
jgi:trimeric autotransporter adhesin